MDSMTGFGRGSKVADGRTLTVELKSVNHRYLDVSIRSPRVLSQFDDVVRKALSGAFARGHVDVYINYRNEAVGAKAVKVDEALLWAYRQAFSCAGALLTELTDDVTLTRICAMPEVLKVEEAPEDEALILELLKGALADAVEQLKGMRRGEGGRLSEDMGLRIDLVEQSLRFVEERAPKVVSETMDKLASRITELMGDVSVEESRLVTEIAVFADRCNVTEEIVRLSSHLKALRELLVCDEPCGRKLDFTVQELNREANTIGSKAGDLEITNAVIAMKGEIEKLREQVQNIE